MIKIQMIIQIFTFIICSSIYGESKTLHSNVIEVMPDRNSNFTKITIKVKNNHLIEQLKRSTLNNHVYLHMSGNTLNDRKLIKMIQDSGIKVTIAKPLNAPLRRAVLRKKINSNNNKINKPSIKKTVKTRRSSRDE